MKHFFCILLSFALLMSSCMTTRYVSEEPALKKKFSQSNVEDIEFEFGKPDEVQETKNGYIYYYYYDGINPRSKRSEEQFIRFAFNNSDVVRQIQSNSYTKVRRISVGKTIFWAAVFPIIILPGAIIVIVVIAAAAANSST
jgi:hypothetical protein